MGCGESNETELVTIHTLLRKHTGPCIADLDGVMTLFEGMAHVPEAVPGAVAHLMRSWVG